MFYCAEQIATKAAAFALDSTERIVSKHFREKLMRQFARGLVIATLAAEKRDDGGVIHPAQFAQCLPRLRRFPTRIAHECPARGVEALGAQSRGLAYHCA
jgi:hypothetical protein